MKIAPLIVSCVAAAASIAAQGTSKPGKVVTVQIIVDTLDAHAAACTAKKLQPTWVLVVGKAVHHCVNGKLIDHDAEKADPAAFQPTLVQVSAGDSIRWESAIPFRVFQLVRHTPVNRDAPAHPFMEPLPTAFQKSVTVGPVLNLEGSVVQQYKVSFELEKIGRVDPDIVCSM